MRISVLLLICLSFIGCIDHPKLPPKPSGLSCTYSVTFKKFYCNEINDPNVEKEFTVEIDLAHCMPLETFEKYQSYVQEIKDIANRECYKQP